MKRHLGGGLVALLFLVTGCNESLRKGASGSEPEDASALGVVSYARVQDRVLTPYCVQCHGQSGGVNLESYANAFAHRDRISSVVRAGAMPPRGDFPPALRDYLLAWLQLGAPETDVVLTPAPEPQPTPAPVDELSYANLRARVFEPFCLRCHNSTRATAGVNLETYPTTLQKIDLIEFVIETDMMPLSGPLNTPEKDLLLRWIAAGAPEGTGTPIPPPVPTPTPAPTPPPPPPAGAVPDYQGVRAAVFVPYCLSCHGNGRSAGGVSLETYNSTKQALSLIEFAVETDMMPMGATLPPDLKDYLLTWVRAGGPELSPRPAPTPTPAPTPAPIPLAPTYASLKANIFAAKCLMCHTPGGMAGNIRFDDYQAMIRQSWLFDRRRPSHSEIIEAVTEKPGKRMPPLQSGLDPLSAREVSTLTDWIARGLPEL